MNWIRFLRHYGPVPRNDNMYDETIQRSARRQRIQPIEFEHPSQDEIVNCFNRATPDPVSVILTGTAGDGKTHLCRKVWKTLNGDDEAWASDSPYLTILSRYPKDRKTWPIVEDISLYRLVKIHFIRDLSGWAPQQGAEWEPEKEELLQRLCRSIFDPETEEIFLIAANDGQLVESWRRLKETEDVKRARQVFEELLVEDRQEQSGVRLKFFNLSRTSSAALFDRAVNAFLSHPGWDELKRESAGENELFGPKCPIRHNYELLQDPLVRGRLRSLLELCDYNGLHVPIRQILLLLSNAVLGHPDAKDHLMSPADVPKLIVAGTVSKASIYNNVFGGNLSEIRRHSITIFDYLERFQIGWETTNRVDNILIFGEGDELLGSYFAEFVAADSFYGADSRYYAAKREYIEGTNENDDKSQELLGMLITQRRGLFFKIPKEAEEDLHLWELTVFKFAGEYLNSVVAVLRGGGVVKRPLLSRIVRGLNRVFTGMLINSDRELYLATSGNYSQAKVSRILVERVSVDPSKGEKVVLRYGPADGRVLLTVFFAPKLSVDFPLTLIRYEFLSRIAMEGALPASFSKECYEDLLAFKSRLIAAHTERQAGDQTPAGAAIGLNLFALTDQGIPEPRFVEIVP
jgi:tRNA A37 threonylcarbamoyladenosine biosynthesis protein TsaE